jgi:hypothetical protein
MLEFIDRPFNMLAGVIDQYLVPPLLYHFGWMQLEELSFDWALVCIYGLFALIITYAVCWPKQASRHVFDATSLSGARYRPKPCLFLDDDGQFFRRPRHAISIRAMRRLNTLEVALIGETWDPLLRELFAQVNSSCMH